MQDLLLAICSRISRLLDLYHEQKCHARAEIASVEKNVSVLLRGNGYGTDTLDIPGEHLASLVVLESLSGDPVRVAISIYVDAGERTLS